MFNRIVVMLAGLALIFGLSACGSSADDAEIVNHNITKAADNFEVNRRIVVINGITDEYLLTVEGACSINDQESQLEVLCKVADGDGADSYKKFMVGLSDNVTYTIEQGEPIQASAYHYRVTFKPQAIVPDVDFRGSTEEMPTTQQ